MLEVELLPAADGDCILLRYGHGEPYHHVLIDGGRARTYPFLQARLREMAEQGLGLELLVLTHIDADHVGGLLKLAADRTLDMPVDEVWLNGFDQLGRLLPMGPRQADRLAVLVEERGWPVNTAFGGSPVVLDSGAQPVRTTLRGGLELTILSPDRARLEAQKRIWQDLRDEIARAEAEKTVAGDGLLAPMGARPSAPGRPDVPALAAAQDTPDTEIANGASIAFLAEFEGKRVLAAGDAHPQLLSQSIRTLLPSGATKLPVDFMKVSHHGSSASTTRALVGVLDCARFAFSGDGSRHPHPEPQAVAKILVGSRSGLSELFFNYRQGWTECWADTGLMDEYGYRCHFPNEPDRGISIRV